MGRGERILEPRELLLRAYSGQQLGLLLLQLLVLRRKQPQLSELHAQDESSPQTPDPRSKGERRSNEAMDRRPQPADIAHQVSLHVLALEAHQSGRRAAATAADKQPPPHADHAEQQQQRPAPQSHRVRVQRMAAASHRVLDPAGHRTCLALRHIMK
jgi:hypothetical protein